MSQTGFSFLLFFLLNLLDSYYLNNAKPPHIIFILADDLGWDDVSFHGSSQISTPNIDALAYDGIILNRYYTQHLCTPSRSALLTGRYPIRNGMQHYVILAGEPRGLPLNETLMPEYFKALGYQTHAVGKWHPGYHKKTYLPSHRGFDSHFGYWNAYQDYYDRSFLERGQWGVDFHEEDRHQNPETHAGEYATEMYTKRVIQIIKAASRSERPLFLYFAQPAPHTGNAYDPIQAPAKYLTRFGHISDPRRRKFAANLAAMDDSFADIIDALERSRMLNDSIVIFSTDNGGAVSNPVAAFDHDRSVGSNWPLRGGKFSIWEGGVRGAAFIWSPLLKASGYHSNHFFHLVDWLPTLLEAVAQTGTTLGPKVPRVPIDGISHWTALNSGPSASSVRNEVLVNLDDSDQIGALIVKNYKLIFGTVFNGTLDTWFPTIGNTKDSICLFDYRKDIKQSRVAKLLRKNGRKIDDSQIDPIVVSCGNVSVEGCAHPSLQSPCLFDLSVDPCERRNLAEKMPEKVQELLSILETYRKGSVPPNNKPIDPRADPKYHGYLWTTWFEEEKEN